MNQKLRTFLGAKQLRSVFLLLRISELKNALLIATLFINAFVQANIGNPQAIANAAQQYGVSPEQLSQATGYDSNTVSNYFGNAGSLSNK